MTVSDIVMYVNML